VSKNSATCTDNSRQKISHPSRHVPRS